MSSSCPSTGHKATLFENGMYIGINLQDILYGIELVLYVRTMKIFLARRRQPHKSDVFYALFSTVMLVLTTIWVAALSTLGQKMWLLDRSYPGGPMAYRRMTDALMIYRCRIVWGSRRVIVVPSILWVVNFGLGMALVCTSSRPGSTFFGGIVATLALAYYSSSTFLNVTLTSMICYRLLRHARTVKDHLGGKHASPYIAIVTLVIESMLPFTLSSITFLISYGLESQSTIVFSFVYPLVMCVSPQMLILRVAMAEAWKKDDCVLPESVIMRAFPEGGDALNPSGSEGSGTTTHSETSPIVPLKPGHIGDQV